MHLMPMERSFPIFTKVKVNVDRPHRSHSRVGGEDCEAVKGLLIVMVGVDLSRFPVEDDGFFVFEDEEIEDPLPPHFWIIPEARGPVPFEAKFELRVVFVFLEVIEKPLIK